MARVNTGDYRIDFYDRYGGRLKLLETQSRSFTESQAKGYHVLKENEEAHSFTVVRQVFNSLDERARW